MRRYLGWLLIVVGTVAMVVGVAELFDPVGTKMADDGDPFGQSEPWYESAVLVVLGLAMSVAGTYAKRK